jgi:hypothetical protein
MLAYVEADLSTWDRLLKGAQEQRLAPTFDLFRSAGIEPILIKGWAACRFYPNSVQRRPGDIDLAVDPQDFEKSLGILENARPAYLVDLHKGLRDLDTVPWNDLFDNSTLVPFGGTDIRVLRPEDHLRLLATHWLLDGGRYQDKLWDIYYAVENRARDFDWERCLAVVEPHRRRWVICAVALAHRYLNLKIDDLPFANEASVIPSWITRWIESEWKRGDDLEPVLASVHDEKLLARQIFRRLPPNPIRSTIEGNGDLYGPWRWLYQTLVLIRRSVPFARDLVRFFSQKLKRGNR